MTNINDLLSADDKNILVKELREKGFKVVPVDKPIHAGIEMFSRMIVSDPDRDMNAKYVAEVIAKYADNNFTLYVYKIDFHLRESNGEMVEIAMFRGYFYPVSKVIV